MTNMNLQGFLAYHKGNAYGLVITDAGNTDHRHDGSRERGRLTILAKQPYCWRRHNSGITPRFVVLR